MPGAFGVVILVSLACFLWRRETKPKGPRKHSQQADKLKHSLRRGENSELKIFSLRGIKSTTKNFSDAKKLGEGGFGPVYKGQLKNGEVVAVKRLSKSSGQGIEELEKEVVLISKLQNRNLVKLLGCCIDGGGEILLYQFMHNKSLHALLFDPRKHAQLDWRTRFNVIEGIARGLLYLHRDSRLRVIHRDLKASSVLLDEEMNP